MKFGDLGFGEMWLNLNSQYSLSMLPVWGITQGGENKSSLATSCHRHRRASYSRWWPCRSGVISCLPHSDEKRCLQNVKTGRLYTSKGDTTSENMKSNHISTFHWRVNLVYVKSERHSTSSACVLCTAYYTKTVRPIRKQLLPTCVAHRDLCNGITRRQSVAIADHTAS